MSIMSINRTSPVMKTSNNAIKALDKPKKTSNRSIIASEGTIMALNKPIKALDKPIMASGKPIKALDKSIKATNRPIMASEGTIMALEKPIKASDKPIMSSGKSVKALDKSIKATNSPIMASAKPIMASEGTKMALEKPVKALDKPRIQSDKQMKKASSIPNKSSGKQIKASDIPFKASNTIKASERQVKDCPEESSTSGTTTENEEKQVKNLEDRSESTRIHESRSLMLERPEKKSLSFVCISDTHCKLTQEIISQIPHADVLLHAGDFTMNGTVRELIEFNTFLGSLSHTYKVVIAGNHEACLEDDIMNKHYRQKFGVKDIRELLTNCVYLQDELTEICGIKIYGSPWTPQYSSCNAFSLCSTEALQSRWEMIPANVDILMTHGPPRGFGDTTTKQVSAGCSVLLKTVQNRIKPKCHVFGHIHEGYGIYDDGTTIFINAATCTRGYKPTNRPIKFRLNTPRLSTCDIDCSVHTDSVNYSHCDFDCDSIKL